MKKTPLVILFVTMFLDLLGFSIIIPLIPLYITHFGGTATVGGMLLACFSVMQFFFSPIWGRMSDRYGRRPMMLISLVGSAISYFCFGAAPTLAFLFLARISAGVLSAASLPTAQAYIADVTPLDKRASGMAGIGVAFGLGFAFGPVLGGTLSQHPIWGIPPLAMPSYFAATLALINFFVALLFLPETHHDRTLAQLREGPLAAFGAISRALNNSVIRAELLTFGVVTFAFTAVETSFSWLVVIRFKDVITETARQAYEASSHLSWAALKITEQNQLIEKQQTATVAVIFSIVGITILFVQGSVMAGLARKVGEVRLVRIGSAVLCITLAGIAFSSQLLWMDFFAAMIAVGTGILNPSISSLITKSSKPEEKGTIAGAQQGLGSLARIIAPPVNQLLLQRFTPIPFLLSAALMFVAFTMSLRLKQPEFGAGTTEPSPIH